METREIDVEKIAVSGLNPRTRIDETGLDELAESVRKVGVLQPILVRPKGSGFEVIAGERRLRAAKMAGLKKIPAIIRDLSDDEVLEIMLIENAQREDLNDVEKGNSCIALLERFPEKYPTTLVLAREIGMSEYSVKNWISVARDVPAEIQKMIATQEKRGDPIPKGSITSQVALQITRSIKEPSRRVEVARGFAEHAIPVHKARKVMKAVLASDKNEPVQELLERLLKEPPEMPFRLDHAYMIANGTKTQTSRFLRPDELENIEEGVVVKANIWEPQFAELEIESVTNKRLGDFTDEDAKREGGYTLTEFKRAWESIHGEGSWADNRNVTVIRFKSRSCKIDSKKR